MERTELADRWAAWFAEYNAGEITGKAFCEARGVMNRPGFPGDQNLCKASRMMA